MKEIVIVHTPKGISYANFIAKEINLAGLRCRLTTVDQVRELLDGARLTPSNTLIHFRTAGKYQNRKARWLEEHGYRVINTSVVLERTSDKFFSYEWASSNMLDLPRTSKVNKDSVYEEVQKNWGNTKFVLKPINSQGRGRFCFRSSSADSSLEVKVSQVPGKEVIVQEIVDYVRIYRVIVNAGSPMRKAVFSDSPTSSDWKVSVCLNPCMTHVPMPDSKLLEYVRRIAEIFETEIGFIDVYATPKGYVLSEINTACSLILHERISGYNISSDIASYLVSQLH